MTKKEFLIDKLVGYVEDWELESVVDYLQMYMRDDYESDTLNDLENEFYTQASDEDIEEYERLK